GNNYGENGEITADGTYTVYFRPNIDGGDDWFYGCIYVAAPTPETTPTETTPEETTPVETTPEETTPVETTPVAEGGFYVAGTMNSWAPVAEYKLTQNALGWYQLNGLELKTTDQFKVAYSEDGVSFKDTDWYPDGMGNNYGENGEITVDGTYTLFFDPTASGGSEWFHGCIFIDMPDPADMFLLGDADGSDEVDAVDATVIQRVATLVKVPYAEEILMQGDVDDDGDLTVIDATFILRYASLAPTPYRIGEYVSR
ncbi:MAG: hypothetical protein IJI48_06735, partial [Ruminococcus sp.]|nr:hypothetical protein [Ruminococcus sp.]